MNEGIGRISEAAKDMKGKATELQTAMNDMAGVAQQLRALSTTMAEGSEMVNEAVTEASAQAEQTAASSEQVSASVEEVTAQIGEITSKASGLTGQVETLDSIARLVLESDERMELYRQDAADQEAEQEKKAA